MLCLLTCLSLAAPGIFAEAAQSTQAPPVVMHVGRTKIAVYIAQASFTLTRSAIGQWIDHSAKGVANYFGGFPVKNLTILVYPSKGKGVTYAETYPRNGAEIKVFLGTESTAEDLKKSWTLVHEMVHLGFPFTDDEQDWATEGLATYCEPFIRAQIGDQTKEQAWADLKGGMAQGLPQPGDRGLNNTRTWGRVYWGGALFYLLADVQIRSRTNYKKGLPDALKESNRLGGNIESRMELDEVYADGDKGTKTQVLSQLYKQVANTPSGADLDSLWKWLGVTTKDGNTVLDNSASMAHIRKAIEDGRAQ